MTTNTCQAVIEKAYVDSMKASKGATLTAAQLADGLDRLNDIANVEQTMGLKLWLESEYSLVLVAGQQLYDFRPGGYASITRPLRVKDATYWDSTSQSRPLYPLSRSEWNMKPARAQQGAVNEYFAEKLYDRLNLYLWQIPDTTAATGTIKLTLHTQVINQTTVSLTTAFPPEWVMFLRWALAADLASGMPVEVIQRCESKAAQYRKMIEDFEVEESPVRLQPGYVLHNSGEFDS